MNFDFTKVFTEDAHDMMPRKVQHNRRTAALGMKSAEDLFKDTTSDSDYSDIDLDADDPNTNETVDANSFEVIGTPKYITREEMTTGISQEELFNYARGDEPTEQIGVAFVMGTTGIVDQVADDDDYQLSVDWFIEATQELMDRSSTGECWCQIINDIAQRFAGFFDGAYQAYDFAAAAFGRRAHAMGIVEQQMMVETFTHTNSFTISSGAIATRFIRYRGRSVELTESGPIRVLRVKTEPATIRFGV